MWGWEMLCFECHCDIFGLFLSLVHVCVVEQLSSGPLCDSPLPNPEMSFLLWTKDLDICKWLERLWWKFIPAKLQLNKTETEFRGTHLTKLSSNLRLD